VNTDQIDAVTLWVFLTPVITYVPWELVVVLWLRPRAKRLGLPMPKTISMVARGLGYRVAALVYLWFGLGVHFWLNRSTWGSAPAGVVFWLVPVALAVWAGFDWGTDPQTWPRWKRTVLHPFFVAPVGALAGYLLFPQTFPW
jgi:hypothetical protein